MIARNLFRAFLILIRNYESLRKLRNFRIFVLFRNFVWQFRMVAKMAILR